MPVRLAKLSDKPAILEVAKQSPYTKGVSTPWAMPDEAFERSEVAVYTHPRTAGVLGFVVVRHLVRKPYTSLYYIGVKERLRSRGVGVRLLNWAKRTSPHGHIRLICETDNTEAHRFYLREQFRKTGEGANRSGAPYFVFEWDAKNMNRRAR